MRLRELDADEEVCLVGAEPVAPYERPALSKDFLTGATSPEPPPLPPEGLDEHGVSLEIDTHVVSIDTAERTLDVATGDQLRYDKLLLATGARPRQLALRGTDLAGVFYLREYREARRLRAALRSARRVVILGGGVIGLEVAASAATMGCAVTVVEIGSQVMGRILPKPLAEAIAALHSSHGVEILTSTRAVAIEGRGGRVGRVRLEDRRDLPADLVLVGVGVEPRTDLAVGAGLDTDDGVLVDEYFRTTADRVFAAGDVARVRHAGVARRLRLEQWQTALTQGRCAAMSMLGVGEPYREVPWMWSDQHDAHIQVAGFDFADAELVRRGELADREGLAFFAVRDGVLVAVAGVSHGAGIARAIRPAQQLIRQQAPITVEQIGDTTIAVRDLARELIGTGPG
jgi:3-phenylpropionate/trans-cinnamate dioxygenase ferredoxin reductase subunit